MLAGDLEKEEWSFSSISNCFTRQKIIDDHIYFVTLLNIPNRTFLVRFGGISGEFDRAMVRILARRSRAKIPMARPN